MLALEDVDVFFFCYLSGLFEEGAFVRFVFLPCRGLTYVVQHSFLSFQHSFIDNHGLKEIDGCLVGTRRLAVDFRFDFRYYTSDFAGFGHHHYEDGHLKR